jgi:hypothetical protein
MCVTSCLCAVAAAPVVSPRRSEGWNENRPRSGVLLTVRDPGARPKAAITVRRRRRARGLAAVSSYRPPVRGRPQSRSDTRRLAS